MSASRVRRLGAAAVAALLFVTAVSAVADNGSTTDEQFRIYRVNEQFGPELVVYLPSEIDTLSIAPKRNLVMMACFDAAGKQILRVRNPWPMQLTGYFPLHIHQPVVDEATLQRVARCRVTGTARSLEGRPQGGDRIWTVHPLGRPLNPAAQGLEP